MSGHRFSLFDYQPQRLIRPVHISIKQSLNNNAQIFNLKVFINDVNYIAFITIKLFDVHSDPI